MNDAPVAGDDTDTTDEDSVLNGAVLGNDTDVEGDALSVTSVTTDVDGEPTDHPVGSPIALASGATLTVNADGTYDYDPNGALESLGAGDEAEETFSYTISDGNGGTSTASVTITITGVNDPVQVSTEDFAPVPEGDVGVLSNVVFDLNDVLTASDVDAGDVPAIDPDSVQVAVAPGSDSTQVAFLVQGSTLVVDTANYDSLAEGQSALFEVTFDVVSGDERVTQSTTIEITGVNDDPVANDDTPSTGEDTGLVGNVLGNDGDVDNGDVLSVTGFSLTVDEVPQDFAPGDTVTLDSGATLTLNANGSFGFDPAGAYDHLAPGETAQETFTYEVSDGNGGTSEATVTITVNGVNDAPVSPDITVEVNSGDTLEGTLTATDVDNPEGDLSFSLVGTAGGATVVVNPDGTYSYTPAAEFIGVDTFEVEVSDGTSTSTVTVTVEVGDDGSDTPGAEGLTLDIATEATPDAPAGNVDIGLSGAGVTAINIVFALDASGSIGSSNWNVMLQNVAAALDVLAEQFDGVEGADVQVSIIRFASDAVTVIEFTDLTFDPVTGESNLHDAIEAIAFTGGGTDWGDTFAEAEAQFLTQTDGGINYLYFVTDGNPTSSFQTELDSLTETIDGLSIYAFAIGSSVNEASLIAIDSVLEPGDDVRSAATTADLTAAVQDTPLFNAALTDFSLSLTADGVDQGVVFSGVGGPLTQSEDGLSYDLPMAEIDGLEDVLGGQNDFVATAGFDIDGDGVTDVTLVSTARIGKADLAQEIAGGDESDLLFGSDAGDVISAGAGNDMVFGYAGDDDIDVGTGDEIVDAGAGDDRVTVGETITGTGDAIDGGAGRDVLVFDFAGDLIDLGGGAHALSGIEAIDMANGHANTLLLDADFVQSLSDTPDSELEGLLGAALGDSLTVYGEAGDVVQLDSAGGFRESTTHGPVTDAEGNTLVIYEMLGAGGEVLATLAVDEDVAVLPPAA
ncbi:MAG: Ig-like domain-containing protein [Paracoccaceae bacterium]